MRVFIIFFFVLSSLFSSETCITNFKTEVCGDFKLLDGVIIKSSLSKQELIHKLKRPLKQIAFLKNTNLYLVDSNDSLNYSKELAKKEYIIYAQPNISQTKEENSHKLQNIAQKYNLQKVW